MILLGAYVPLTMEGNIMVDGVLASCYASTDNSLAHIGMIHVRWFPKTMEWIFGDENELSIQVKILEEVGRWLYLL